MPSTTPASPERAATHRRAVEAVIWGMPAVNYQMMYEASARTGGPGDNQVVYLAGLAGLAQPDAHTEPRRDLRDAVLQHQGRRPHRPRSAARRRPGLAQRQHHELLAGRHRGCRPGRCRRGPRRAVRDPAARLRRRGPEGYIPLRSDTYQCYGLIRSVLPQRHRRRHRAGRRLRPAHRALPPRRGRRPPDTAWVDACGPSFDAAIPYDLRFFQALDRIVQAEPWLDRDRVMIDQLRTIGIEKGSPFDTRPRNHGDPAAAASRRPTPGSTRSTNRSSALSTTARDGRCPHCPMIRQPRRTSISPTRTPSTPRGVAYSFAFFSSKHLGKGQFYLMTLADRDGAPLHGAATYRLTVPADAPVTQYWS